MQGVARDRDRAFSLYSAAAEQGNVKAMVALGLCFKVALLLSREREREREKVTLLLQLFYLCLPIRLERPE